MKAVEVLNTLARARGLTVIARPNGHYQIAGGAALVNYYPESKHRTAYIDKTKAGHRDCSPERAIELALKPPVVPKAARAKRKNNLPSKKKLYRRSKVCHWCRTPLSFEEATVDHIVPLARGGLNNANNKVLSCAPCNHGRGHNMPEART